MATGQIFLHPNAGVPTSTLSATWKWADDTTQEKGVIEYLDAVTSHFDWQVAVPGDWTNAGNLIRLYWRGAAASANSVVWNVSTISRANTETTDQAFNTTDAATLANGAATANILNIDTITLTNGVTGLAANELLYVRISRIGGDGSDNYAAAAQLLFAVVDYTVA